MTVAGPDAAARAAWLAQRRRATVERYDQRWAPIYDEKWGASISATHEATLARLLAALPAGSSVLDAACGTGKYWPMIIAAGHRPNGIDQSAGMLAVAQQKYPEVAVRRLCLQDLSDEGLWDAVLCIDAMEFVPPEEWPVVAGNLRRALRMEGRAYLTVEQADPDAVRSSLAAARAAGHPVVEGEDFADGGYHYYPDREQVLGWLGLAGFAIDDATEGDDYLHLLLTAAA